MLNVIYVVEATMPPNVVSKKVPTATQHKKATKRAKQTTTRLNATTSTASVMMATNERARSKLELESLVLAYFLFIFVRSFSARIMPSLRIFQQ